MKSTNSASKRATSLHKVHECSGEVCQIASDALRHKAAYDRHMDIAQGHLEEFIEKRDFALQLAHEEYPDLAKSGSIFDPHQCVIMASERPKSSRPASIH